MNRLLLSALIVLGVAASASAQNLSPRLPSDAELNALTTAVPADAKVARPVLPMAKTADTEAMYYHDTQLSQFIWRVPSNYGNFQSIWIGQRFTLPAAAGILDSILVYIRELPIGEMRFVVMKNTDRVKSTLDTTKYHFPDYFSTPAGISVVDTARLSAFDIDTTSYCKVDFNAKQVEQEFHIVMQPTTASGLTNMFGAISDAYDSRLPGINPTDDRTHMVISYQSQALVLFMDQLFRNTTDTSRRLMVNFYMVAFARIGTVAGMETVAIPSNPELDQNFPNPVNAGAPFTTIAFETATTGLATLEVFDAVGRSVAKLHDGMLAAGKHSMMFRTAGLAPGMYNYRLTLDGRQAMRRMLVLK